MIAMLPPEPKKSRRASLRERVVTEWRRLTGGKHVRDDARRTLVACSGGADSAALAIALASKKHQSVALAYIAHDLRDRVVVERERQVVRDLATRLGCAFVSAEVAVRQGKGNKEAIARRLRYATLRDLAVNSKCSFVASGHQATDQLETLLMRLLRGTGTTGLRGVAERRPLGHGVFLVRPMLRITREEAEKICTEAGYEPLVDSTNADLALLRNAIRLRVIPVLKELRPGVERRASIAAMLQSESAELMKSAVDAAAQRCGERVDGERTEWNRKAMQKEANAAVRALLWKRIREKAKRADRVDHAAMRQVMEVIISPEVHRKEWTVGGVKVVVTAKTVVCERVASSSTKS